jgi:2-succinyl-6-hydroxy-2,4-cyclohexadiene-1-carboxylate synthase
VTPLPADAVGPPNPAAGGAGDDNHSTVPPLALLHGFTQTGRLWGPFGELLAAGRTLVRPDLPGHGGSGPSAADLPGSARSVMEAIDAAVPSAPVDLCGYSLGGRVALHVALAFPARLRRLVLIGATPGIRDPVAREARAARDEELAQRIEGEDDVDAFVSWWLHLPMFARIPTDAAGIEERRRNTTAGLAASLRLAGTGAQQPLWDRLASLELPVLVIAGGADVRFASIGAEMVRVLPHAVLALVPGAGHAAHLEQPVTCARLVTHWLDETGPRAAAVPEPAPS